MVNWYLFTAYSLVWLIFVVYVWILAKRQARLIKELADLRNKLHEEGSAGSRSPQS
ncbi:MAG: CcmD family protein [Terriglobia bacterium]